MKYEVLTEINIHVKTVEHPRLNFFLMPVFLQALFALVSSHFMSFSLLTAWHYNLFLNVFNLLIICPFESIFISCIPPEAGLFYRNCALYFLRKGLCRFKRRNMMSGNNQCCIPGNIPSCFFRSFFYYKTSETP